VKKSVLLTFDDGLKHVWTVAYPLLKKYGLRATCFLIPGCIPENGHQTRATLEEVLKQQASLEDVVSLGHGDSAFATWAEIKVMHESGVIDFQSHTMYHSLVFASDKIFDFMNPDYDKYFYGNIRVPLYSIKGEDVISRDAPLGMPIYFAKPRMSAPRRFFDDEELRNQCIEMVSQRGSHDFFRKQKWRKVLRHFVLDYRKRSMIEERYETLEERDKAITAELLASRKTIEEKLSGKKVTHLCYPWYEAADFAIDASKKAGFKANYFGLIKGNPTNLPGNDPFRVARVEDFFLQRLPGKGRKTIIDIFKRLNDLRTVPHILGLSNKE
jgi:peptidoglycan/xylan/chitin deacetylase (PgdA/CDA1 family)